MNFYKHYIGDFQRDTSHLTMTERGAYLSLMHHYYATETCLPNDHAMLCRIAGAMTKPERDAVKVAAGFFEAKPEGLWHKRIEAELEKTDGKRDANKKIALEREAKKRAAKLAQTEHETCSKRGTNVVQTEHENSTIPEPDTRLKQSSVESEGGAGISIPEPITPAPLSSVNVFPMSLDWSPSIEFQKTIPPHLNGSNDLWLKDLANFCLYRSARGEKFTQAQWELHFYKDLEANQKHRGVNIA
jgi:uncharacterized protein YdaU (DUF1376 family)